MSLHFKTPIYLVRDIEISKVFYEKTIGAAILQDFGSFVVFEGNFAIHSADVLYEYIDKQYTGGRLGADNIELYFASSDLAALQEKLIKENVTFIHPIRECPWGEKVLRIYDPDGHIVEIGDAV